MRRLAVCILFAVVACSPGTESDGFVLDEWAISGPEHLDAEVDTITVENSGEWSHTLVVTTEGGHVVAASGLIESGASTTLGVALEPGAYVFSCRIVAQDDEGALSDHYERGMSRGVVVEA
jgi:plastocyanin